MKEDLQLPPRGTVTFTLKVSQYVWYTGPLCKQVCYKLHVYYGFLPLPLYIVL